MKSVEFDTRMWQVMIRSGENKIGQKSLLMMDDASLAQAHSLWPLAARCLMPNFNHVEPRVSQES